MSSLQRALVVIVGAAVAFAAFQAFSVRSGVQISVVRIDFVRTKTDLRSGEVITVERGVRYLADDGRIRVDVFRGDEHTTVLLLPSGSRPGINPGRRIDVTHADREATVASTSFYWSVPGVHMELPDEPPDPEGVAEDLGTRSVGPLRLRGFRDFVDGIKTESWHLENSPKPQVVEQRVETGESVDETRIQAVTSTGADERMFDVPAGYGTRELEPWIIR